MSTAALFIDWLSMLDPEIIQANPDLEQKLLFARSLVGKGEKTCK